MASTLSIRQFCSIRGAANSRTRSSAGSRLYPRSLSSTQNADRFYKALFSYRNVISAPGATSGISPANQNDDDEDGVSLGTMKLPSDTDIPRFEALLFQWANSLCQGANLPLPVPLKVDRIGGGVRLGFVTIGDGSTEVLVHIDCLVYPPNAANPVPFFRAIRNGPLKDKSPPGEPRIMKSLLAALQKSVEIAKV